MDIFKKGSEEKMTVSGEYLVITYPKEVEAVTRVLSIAGTRVAYASGQKLQGLVFTETSDDTMQLSIVYAIPCGGCSAAYYGETAREMERIIKEHKSDLRHDRTTN